MQSIAANEPQKICRAVLAKLIDGVKHPQDELLRHLQVVKDDNSSRLWYEGCEALLKGGAQS